MSDDKKNALYDALGRMTMGGFMLGGDPNMTRQGAEEALGAMALSTRTGMVLPLFRQGIADAVSPKKPEPEEEVAPEPEEEVAPEPAAPAGPLSLDDMIRMNHENMEKLNKLSLALEVRARREGIDLNEPEPPPPPRRGSSGPTGDGRKELIDRAVQGAKTKTEQKIRAKVARKLSKMGL